MSTGSVPAVGTSRITARVRPLERAAPILTSGPAVIAAMLGSLGIFYLLPGIAWAAVGLALFFVLTVYRPNLSVALIPLAAPLFYRPRFITPTLLFSPGEVILLTCAAAWTLRDAARLVANKALPRVRELPLVWLCAAGVLGLIGAAWLFVPDPAHRRYALREFRWTVVEPLLFFCLMLRWLRTERDLWRMVAAWLVAATLVGRLGIEQYLFGQTWSMEGVGRASSVYPSATAFGIYSGRALALAVTLAFLLPSKWWRWKIGVGLLSFVIGLGTLFSFARGAWIGVFVALVVVAIISRCRPLLLSLGGALLLGLAALPFVRAERITSMFNFATPDNTGLSRLRIWSGALRAIADHPITGIGQDQFLYLDAKYGVPQLRFLPASHPHNWILDFWLRLGLPGLLWAVGALTLFFWYAIRVWAKHKGQALGALALGLLASMIDFAVHGLMDMAYFTMDLALTFWLTVGLLVLIGRTAPTSQAVEMDTAKDARITTGVPSEVSS